VLPGGSSTGPDWGSGGRDIRRRLDHVRRTRTRFNPCGAPLWGRRQRIPRSLNCRKLQTDATWQPSCPFQGGLCNAGKSRTKISLAAGALLSKHSCGVFCACPTLDNCTDGIGGTGIGIADRYVANGLHRLRRMGLNQYRILEPADSSSGLHRASLTGPEGDAI